MGIALTYKPTPAPAADVLKAMAAEALSGRPLEQWWSEPINFLDVPSIGVVGMTKVSIPGYSGRDGSYVEVDPTEDFLMMWNDVSHIAQLLSNWAKKFNLSWEIELEGEPFGSIDSSGLQSDELTANLLQLLQMSNAPKNPAERQAMVASIDSRYKSRWS